MKIFSQKGAKEKKGEKLDKESYRRGFEDCAELCFIEISESKTL